MKKQNILHVIDHLGLGGAQTIVRDIVEKNINHRVFSLRQAENQVKFSSKSEGRVRFFRGSKYSFGSVFSLRDEVIAHDIDVLHVHLSKAIFVAYLYKLLFFNDVKVVVNEHGAVFSPKRWFYRFVLRRISKYASYFIAVSKKTKSFLVDIAKLNSDKIEVVYNFIDFDELKFLSGLEKSSLRKSLGFSDKDFLVGFAGRLSKVKSIETLIDASKYLNGKNIKVVIIGDGELRGELEMKAAGIDNVFFLGFREDIKNLYQILDVIVLPSYSEASPMTFYESQVYGIPFVGSNVYAINEFIKDGFNGFLFEFQNDEELAEKVMKIYGDEKVRDRIKKNAISVLKKYDFKLYMKKLEEIYNG